ncbi:hypothetical protein E4T52_16133 [Aureobasidium sp. EXF-3400]|nr:hypothetical protein E4T51_10258 [Aureobasidium sp. EXF-12344]KAI4768800.1 hypothetical protein E4T52_16133 [Aureobasidium sp. EXF-3400]
MYLQPNLQPRQYYGYYNRCYGNNCNSTWNRWGRWVLLACIIGVFFVLFFLFSCLSARRRRKNGNNPYYGTGWTVRHGAPTYNQNVQPQYETSSTPYYNNSNNPPPAYTAPNTYGNNIELQQPQAAYNGAYAPPKDPPPGRY